MWGRISSKLGVTVRVGLGVGDLPGGRAAAARPTQSQLVTVEARASQCHRDVLAGPGLPGPL